MESPSLIILKLSSSDKEALLSMMQVLQSMGKSFYYCQREDGLRILIRSRSKLNALMNEAKALGLKIRRYYP
jgi:hypothetical protein